MGAKDFIEINGKRYDAVTGVPLVGGHHKNAAADKPAAQKQPAAKVAAHAAKPKEAKVKPAAGRRQAPVANPHAPRPSSTLMRHAVKKPAPSLRRQVRAHGSTDSLLENSAATAPAPTAKPLDDRLLRRAEHVSQSKAIRHFSAVTSDNRSGAAVAEVRPAALPTPSADKPRPGSTAALLEHALRNAPAHEVPAAKPAKHRRHKAGLAGVAAVLLITAATAGHGLTDLRLHQASASAGFSVSLPGYQPAGYSLGRLASSNGEALAQFHSNSSSDNYSVTQKRSDWDSQTLLNNFVIATDPDYQTVNSNGLTIYIYSQHNATWVNGGLWYIVQGNAGLTQQQLVQLATSF